MTPSVRRFPGEREPQLSLLIGGAIRLPFSGRPFFFNLCLFGSTAVACRTKGKVAPG
jgi:hypothetical protein